MGQRILGVDPGGRRTGFALSDPSGRVAQGAGVFEGSRKALLERVVQLAAVNGVRRVVVGLPLNMDGTVGDSARAALQLVRGLAGRLSVPVVTWDERLTSAAAERAVLEMGGHLRQQKRKVNEIAAMMILQEYLDRANAGGLEAADRPGGRSVQPSVASGPDQSESAAVDPVGGVLEGPAP